ncbi:MAG: hypothetical protein AAFO82_19435 [Bacteroidota bacterium]
MKLSVIVAIFAMLSVLSCQTKEENMTAQENPVIAVEYPETATVEQEDNYFGITVGDPYRWLEDDRSEETGEWVKAQNKVTSGYLEQIPYREAIEERYAELFNYPKLSSPFKVGEYYFVYK